MRKFITTSILLLFATIGFCQNKSTIIKAGKLIDVENGTVLLNQMIWVRNDSIIQVANKINIPNN